MFAPTIATRMKQRNHSISLWIDAGNIRSFIEIAVKTAECEICGDRTSAVLSGNHVINLKWSQRYS
jgi:hypothetical protein